ncbi:MAG: phage tail protein [Ferrovibrio sp.]|uniref:phage tail tube protein n=1 Tax=Ferrovibrio sp. TaxID=1917215 RepID=UPI00262D29E9|nr:phage tail tube protein [Ferrovibrio sp.]MCW0235280.1 phage tail protein [Ferrovibrio sp.]
MAIPQTARFGKFRVLLGNGADPEVYAAPCGFTSKSLNLIKNLSDVAIPDCDDPDAAIALARDVQTNDWNVGGEGVLAAASVATWLDAYDSTESVAVKIEVQFTSGTITFTGNAHLASFGLGAEQGGRVTVSVDLQGDGPLTHASTIA